MAGDVPRAVGRKGRGRLWLLIGLLSAAGITYLSLPRSWFEVPDDRSLSPAKQQTPSVQPTAKSTPIDTLRDAAERAPTDYTARSHYGMALVSAGRTHEAESEFMAARRLAPEARVVHYNLGVFYMNLGALKLADASFCRELELAPGDPRAHYYRGVVAQRQLRTDAAIAQFRYTVAAAPEMPDPYLALAVEATRKEPEAQIRQYADRYVALTGNKALAYYVLSGAYRTWGRYAEAARYGELSVAAEPDNYAYWHNLGQVYSYGKRTQEAERALGEALKRAKDPSTVLIELGINSEASRRFTDAVAYFQRALAASPQTGHIHSYLSRAYHLMGDEAASEREVRAFRAWNRELKQRGLSRSAHAPVAATR